MEKCSRTFVSRIKRHASFAVIALLLVATAGRVQATSYINSNRLWVTVREAPGGVRDDEFSYDTSIPTNITIVAAIGANHYSRTTAEYSTVNSGAGTLLHHRFRMNRPGSYPNSAYFANGDLRFTTTQDTSYDLSGSIRVADSGGPGRVWFTSYLRDVTTGQTLFDNLQFSRDTVNEEFILGLEEGDVYSYLHPGSSLNGSLQTGHEYEWYSAAFIDAYPDDDGGASATGVVKLAIGDVAAIPEPTSILVWSLLGTVGIGAYRRQFKATPAG